MIDEQKLPNALRDLVNSYPQEESKQKLEESWPELIKDLALLNPAILEQMATNDETIKEFGEFYELSETTKRLTYLSDLVRRLWTAPQSSGWTVKLFKRILLAHVNDRIEFNWLKRSLLYHPQTTVEQVLYYLFEHRDLAKHCANVECARPFFMATRATERYCSDACFKNAQRLASHAWWQQHGNQWRRSRQKSKSRSKK